jgi:hypothetical protein
MNNKKQLTNLDLYMLKVPVLTDFIIKMNFNPPRNGEIYDNYNNSLLFQFINNKGILKEYYDKVRTERNIIKSKQKLNNS